MVAHESAKILNRLNGSIERVLGELGPGSLVRDTDRMSYRIPTSIPERLQTSFELGEGLLGEKRFVDVDHLESW